MCFPKNFAEVLKNTYFVERQQTATSEASCKNKNSSIGQIISTDEEILSEKKDGK